MAHYGSNAETQPLRHPSPGMESLRRLGPTPPSRPMSRFDDGTQDFIASALGAQQPRAMGSPRSKQDFSAADEDVPFFPLGGEALTHSKHLGAPLLNLGELVVEGASEPHHGSEEVGVFESFFDLTEQRLKVIFDALDSQSTQKPDGVADFEQLRRGLVDAGVKVGDEEGFARLVKQVDQDLDGGLTFNEFEAVVQSLKMAYLLRGVSVADIERNVGPKGASLVRVIDYSIGRIVHRNPTVTDFTDFLYGPRPEWASNRWIDVSAPCPLVIKGLAIKYRLHPLSLEDALHNEFEQGAKLDRYPNHSFIVFPGMFIDSDSAANASSTEASVHAADGRIGAARIRRARYPRLRRLNPSKRLLEPLIEPDTKSLESADPALTVLASFPGVVHYNVCMFLTRPKADTLVTVVDSTAGGAVFRRVRNELQVSYSRLRSQSALFVMYTVLDVLVDNLGPVMDAFEEHIAALRTEVREHTARRGILFDAETDSAFLARYHDVLHELTRAKRRLTPAIRVLSQLTMLEDVDPDCRVYLRDVLDHAEDVVERLNAMAEDCKSLNQEQQHSIDSKLTKSMAALTVVGVIFMPGQFFTGVFGMNFRNMRARASSRWPALTPPTRAQRALIRNTASRFSGSCVCCLGF